MRCGPGVWSAITRTVVGRVVSVIVGAPSGRWSRGAAGDFPDPGPLRRPVPSRCGRARPYRGGVGGERPVNPKGLAPSEASGLDRPGASTHPPHPPRRGGNGTATSSAAAHVRPPLTRPLTAPLTRPAQRADLRPRARSGRLSRRPRRPASVAAGPAGGGVQVVDRPLSLAAGGDEGPGVLAEDGQPVAEVGGVVGPGGLLEPELGAPERGAELGDQFLGAVGAITEPAGQIPVEPRRGGRSSGRALIRTIAAVSECALGPVLGLAV